MVAKSNSYHLPDSCTSMSETKQQKKPSTLHWKIEQHSDKKNLMTCTYLIKNKKNKRLPGIFRWSDVNI